MTRDHAHNADPNGIAHRIVCRVQLDSDALYTLATRGWRPWGLGHRAISTLRRQVAD